MSSRFRLAVLCVTVGALLCAAPAAHAACTSSTPSNASFTDSGNDAVGAAPELTELKFSVDAVCTFTFDPGLATFTNEQAIATFIDSDGNPNTGAPELFGSDVIAVTFRFETDTVSILGWWDGRDFLPDASSVIEAAPSPGGFGVAVDRLGIAPGATAAFRVFALGAGDEDFDAAPDSDDPITMTVNYDGTPVVPTFPPPTTTTDDPTPSPFPQLPVVPPTTTPACTVPKVNGRSLAVAKRRLTASGCTRAATVTRRYSNSVPKGRVIGTSPGTGARTTKKVKLIVSKGKRPKRAKSAAVRRDLVTRAQAILSEF